MVPVPQTMEKITEAFQPVHHKGQPKFTRGPDCGLPTTTGQTGTRGGDPACLHRTSWTGAVVMMFGEIPGCGPLT